MLNKKLPKATYDDEFEPKTHRKPLQNAGMSIMTGLCHTEKKVRYPKLDSLSLNEAQFDP